MTEKPRETQAESHVVELKEKVNNSSLMKHPAPLCRSDDLTPGARFQKLVSQRKSPEIPMLARP